jgi:hypothetical protein
LDFSDIPQMAADFRLGPPHFGCAGKPEAPMRFATAEEEIE